MTQLNGNSSCTALALLSGKHGNELGMVQSVQAGSTGTAGSQPAGQHGRQPAGSTAGRQARQHGALCTSALGRSTRQTARDDAKALTSAPNESIRKAVCYKIEQRTCRLYRTRRCTNSQTGHKIAQAQATQRSQQILCYSRT